jgi:hypothetical protein
MTPLLDRVAAKMPVVVHDSDAPKSQRKAFVGTDNVAAGKLAGQAAIDALKAANISKGKVAMFVGRIDMQNSIDRKRGIDETLGKQPGSRSCRVPGRRRPQQGEEERRGRAGALPRPGDGRSASGRTTARRWSTREGVDAHEEAAGRRVRRGRRDAEGGPGRNDLRDHRPAARSSSAISR